MKFPPPVIEPFQHPLCDERDVKIYIKRDDLIHSVISGNKLFKLSLYLNEFINGDYKTLITFGGAYSNHVHATAFKAKEMGIKSVGIIRGEQIIPLNPTLKDVTDWGMTLEPVSRESYKRKDQSPDIKTIINSYEKPFVIPEGGCDALGVLGAARILEAVDQSKFDYIVCACGTATTLSGLIHRSAEHIKLLGVPVLKAKKWMQQEVQDYLHGLNSNKQNWQLMFDYHFGGYAKTPENLLTFISEVEVNYGLELDPIYTGKAFYGLLDQIQKGQIKSGSNVLFIHTGGLQGRRSFTGLS